MSFLRGPMRVEEATVEVVMLFAGVISMAFYLLIGRWSDRVGRNKPIIIGALASLVLLFPIFWGIGALANPGLAASAQAAPVKIRQASGVCDYDPFASKQSTECGRLAADLTSLGVRYDLEGVITPIDIGPNDKVFYGLSIGNRTLDLSQVDDAARKATVQSWLEAQGYDFAKQTPPFASLAGIVALLCCLGMLSALTYGSVAALLAEMFPPQIRYSSMSIPYHIGAGYLGGFLPLIAGYIVATTGNPYSGLWYTWGVVLVAFVVSVWGLPAGPPRDFADDG
jgi:MFS family permease